MPDSLWSPTRRPLTLGLVLTITLVASESLAISAAMPIVAKDLGGHELYGWVFSAFFLGSLVGITVVGGLIDERGLAVPFIGGLVLFGVGLLIGGLAPSMPVLVFGRLIQGLGGGATPPIAYVAIGRALPEHLRPRMFANLSTAWVLPGVFGPGIAGFIAQAFHWRLVFLGLIPLLVIAGAIAARALAAADRAHPSDARAAPMKAAEHRRRLALAVGVAVGGALLTAGLQAPQPAVFVSLVAAGLAMTLVCFRRLTPPGTFRLARGYPAAVLLRGLLTFTFFTIDPYVTLLLVDVRGWPAALAGVGLTGATVAWTVGSWWQARRSGHITPSRFVRIGWPIATLGIAVFGLGVFPAVPAAVSVVAFAVAGFGMGIAYAQFAIIVLRDAPLETQGTTTAAISLTDMFGTALGTGVTNAIIAASLRSGAGLGVAAATATGIGVAVIVAVLAGVAGSLLAPRLRRPDLGPGVAVPVR